MLGVSHSVYLPCEGGVVFIDDVNFSAHPALEGLELVD